MPYQRLTPAYRARTQPVPVPRPQRKVRLVRGEKVGPAFWTTISLLSLVVNVILVAVLVALAGQLFALKDLVHNQLLGGLYGNFVKMDQAHIRTTIPIQTDVPAQFDLPLNTTTMVTLTENITIQGATIYGLRAGPLSISSATANIILPVGTQLPIALNLNVPVDQRIPVNLTVDVDIPLDKTELHEPFVGLQDVVRPYYNLLGQAPDSWQEVVCGDNPTEMCIQLFRDAP